MSILITGGTGSFGRAFARHALNRYERVCIYSRGEHAQAQMREEFGDNPRFRWFIGDVRDRDRLRRAMERVDTVVHAAALKRIEVGHYNPIEMVKTNVMGAVNVIEAAHDMAVARVIALSTDKAWQPISPYGHSKALAESLFIAANNMTDRTMFSVCRYGNVAGSSGSVIPRWRDALKSGDTVPVTDPDCTRFWMRMDEAVVLVMGMIDNMKGGEMAIPENLPAYRLGDLAEAMGAKMRITGLNMFEKKHEGMWDGLTSDTARRMTIPELKEGLRAV